MHWLNVILERIWSKLSNTLFHFFTLSFVLFSSKHWLTVIVIVEEFLKTQENTYHILLNETKIFSWCHDARFKWHHISAYTDFLDTKYSLRIFLPFEMVKIPFQSPNFCLFAFYILSRWFNIILSNTQIRIIYVQHCNWEGLYNEFRIISFSAVNVLAHSLLKIKYMLLLITLLESDWQHLLWKAQGSNTELSKDRYIVMENVRKNIIYLLVVCNVHNF